MDARRRTLNRNSASGTGRFGGWPANHGLWAWGDEILVGFSAGYFKDYGPARHAIDRERPEEHLLARSKDGGRTWQQVLKKDADTGASDVALDPCGGAAVGLPTLRLVRISIASYGLDTLSPGEWKRI